MRAIADMCLEWLVVVVAKVQRPADGSADEWERVAAARRLYIQGAATRRAHVRRA